MKKKQTLAAIIFIVLGFSAKSRSEYRLFNLEITDSVSKKTRTVVSNLDPDQYISYYGIGVNETIKYTSTWMCYGRTSDFTDYCQDPKKVNIPGNQDTTIRPPTVSQ